MTIDFDRSFASSPKAEFWSDRNEKKPRDVFKNSHKKFWFNCGDCKHTFDIRLGDVTNKNNWCPYCANRKLCEEDCVRCFEKTFANHPKAEFWDYSKNEKKPRDVFKSSHKKFWFICGECKHSFYTCLNDVTNGYWCPYCTNRKLCKEDCTQCFEKSFASHPKAEFWSDRNEKKPEEMFKNSNKKFWFNCGDCKHSFDTRLGDVTNGYWCPYCANPPKRLCKEDCVQCFEKSFASHPKAEFWSDRNDKKPRNVFKNSGTKFWFDCGDNHSFDTRLDSITNSYSWCPMCKNKTEKMFLKWFKNNYEHVINHQAKYDWCKNKRRLPFDFSVESLKLIIEIDGPQHYRQISNWQSPEITQERDDYKELLALENGYIVVRILQEDIFKNVIGWENELVEILN